MRRMAHFNPSADLGPCWVCQHYERMTPRANVVCGRPNASRIQATPETGCAFWSRDPGVDDFVPIE
jgi:hypothetical protein